MSSGFSLTSRPLIEIIHLFLAAGWRRRYLICVPIILLPPLALGVSKFAPQKYEARMTLLVQEPAKLNPFLEDLTVATNLKERISALRALGRSHHILGGAARDLGLITEDMSVQARDTVVKRLASSLNVSLFGAELLELRLRGDSPDGLDRILASIGRRFIDQILAPERSSITDSVAFLTRQMEDQQVGLETAEDELAAFKTKHADSLPNVQSSNMTRLSQLRQALDDDRTALAGADAALADLSSRLARNNPVIANIEERIVTLSAQLAQLRSRYTDRHSDVASVQRQLSRLREERTHILSAVGTLTADDLDRLWSLASTRSDLSQAAADLLVSQLGQLQEAQAQRATLQRRVSQLEMAIAELERRVAAHGAVERELNTLERDVAIRRDLYDGLVRRFEMARVTGALGQFEAPDRIQVIDPPTEDPVPVGPGKLLFLIAGVFGGIALGLGLAVLFEVLDSTIRSREVIENLLGVPVLGRIPPLKPSLDHASDIIDGQVHIGPPGPLNTAIA